MNSLSSRVLHPFPACRPFPALVLFLTVLLWCPAARAAVVSWTNAAGGDWNLSSNWDTGQVPMAADSVQITLDGTYSVTVGANVKVQSLLVGAISGVQTVEASTCTLMVSGIAAIGTRGRLTLADATMNGFAAGMNLDGVLEAHGTSHLAKTLTTSAGSLIRVEGDSTGEADFQITSGFTNNGVIEISSTSAVTSATLTVSGLLTNPAGGEIRSLAGAGGPERYLGAEVLNQGTIQVDHPLYISKIGGHPVNSGVINLSGGDLTFIQQTTLSTTGTISISAGRTLTVSGGTFTRTGGTLGGAGRLLLSSATATLEDAAASLGALTLSGSVATCTTVLDTGTLDLTVTSSTLNAPGLLNGAGKSVVVSSGKINAPVENSGTIIARGSGTIFSDLLENQPGATLRVEGNVSYGNAVLTVSKDATNHGLIELTSASSSNTATLAVSNGITNASDGVIRSLAGSGGSTRNLQAALLNHGTIEVLHPLTISKASADHIHDGTILVSGGNLSVTQTGSSPSFTTSGSISIAASRTLTITNGDFTLAGGTITGAGAMTLSSVNATLPVYPGISGLLTLSGSTVAFGVTINTNAMNLSANNSTLSAPGFQNPVGKTFILTSDVLNTPIDNQGTLVARQTGSWNGALTTAVGSTVRVEGTSATSASLTVAGGFTNRGTVELTSSDSGQTATLGVTMGTLTNASGAVIQSIVGSGGGSRTLAAQISNLGTITVSHPLIISKDSAQQDNSGLIQVSGANLSVVQTGSSPAFTNPGSVILSAGRTLTITGGSFTAPAGSITGAGTLAIDGVNFTMPISTATLNFSPSNSTLNGPTLVNPAGHTLTLTSCVVNVAVDNQATLVARGATQLNMPVDVPAGTTLRAEGISSLDAVLTAASGFTNHGTIELTTTSTTRTSSLNVTSGQLVNAPDGTFGSAGIGGFKNRGLGAELVNQGFFYVSQPLVIDKPSAHHVNTGLFVAGFANLTVTQSGTSPSFTNLGTLRVTSPAFVINGGTFTHGGGTIEGFGTFQLTGVTAAMGDAATITAGLNLVSTVATFTTGFSSAGTALTASSSTMYAPSVLNAPSRIMSLTSSTVHAPVTNQGTLQIRGVCSLDSGFTTSSGSRIQVAGEAFGSATLSVPGGFTNNGSLELHSGSPTYTASVDVGGGTLTNGSLGVIKSLPNTGAIDPRTIVGELQNQGSVEVSYSLVLSRNSAHHVNSGTVTVTGGNLTLAQSGSSPSFTNSGTFTIGTGRTVITSAGEFVNASGGTLKGTGTLDVTGAHFTNAGTVAPGTSPGTLSVNGNGTLLPTSQLLFEIGGLPTTSFDRMLITGSAELDGALSVTLINGYVPSAGDLFPIISWASHSGTFDVMNGMDFGDGLHFTSQYPGFAPDGLTLETVRQAWTLLSPAGTAPDPRYSHSAVYDASSNRMIVFGGESTSGPRNDVWVLTTANGVGGTPGWLQLSPVGPPPEPRAGHSAVYDPAANAMIVFGGSHGSAASELFGDLWVLSNANGLGGVPQWTEIHPAGAVPAPRTNHSAAYNPLSGRMVIVGGIAGDSCSSPADDVWSLSGAAGPVGSAAWSQLVPGGDVLPGRSLSPAAFDVADDRLIVLGGRLSCPEADGGLRILSNADGLGGSANWQLVTPLNGTVPEISGHSIVYDESLNRLVVFGGQSSGGPSTAQVLLVSNANGTGGETGWTILPPPATAPSARERQTLVYDPGRRAILFGGLTAAGPSNQVWTLEISGGNGSVSAVPSAPDGPKFIAPLRISMPPSPNPTRTTVHFAVTLDRDLPVGIVVCDVTGRLVGTIYEGPLGPGIHSFSWDSRSTGSVANGVYWIRATSGAFTDTDRFVIAR